MEPRKLKVLADFEHSVKQKMDRCIHYRAMSEHLTCEVGIVYKDQAPGWLHHACHGGADSPCAVGQYKTREDAEADTYALDEYLAGRFEQLNNNICPTHNIPITKQQVGCCVYAKECGCRLYHGKIL
jgi:hypothetical protein